MKRLSQRKTSSIFLTPFSGFMIAARGWDHRGCLGETHTNALEELAEKVDQVLELERDRPTRPKHR